MADAPEEHFLYRHYRRAPAYRYACTIVADPKRPAGFRVIDSDPAVADTAFMTTLDTTFRKVHSTRRAKYTKAAIIDQIVEIQPRKPGHFEATLEALQGAGICHEGLEPDRHAALMTRS